MRAKRIPPPSTKEDTEYRRLWRVVEGAVRDAFKQHPEYLTELGHQSAQMSIVKRVTGTVRGFAVRQNVGDTAGTKSGSAHQPERVDGDRSEKEEA